MGATQSELGERLTSREFAEIVALLGVEPWGGYRQDFLHGLSAWSAAAVWSKEAKLKDFVPQWGKTEEQREKEIWDNLRAHSQIASATPARETKTPKTLGG